MCSSESSAPRRPTADGPRSRRNHRASAADHLSHAVEPLQPRRELRRGAFSVFDAVKASFKGRLDSGRLRLEGQASWGDDATLAVDVRMPLKVTLKPFAVRPPDLEQARGSVKLQNVSLARFEEMLME